MKKNIFMASRYAVTAWPSIIFAIIRHASAGWHPGRNEFELDSRALRARNDRRKNKS